MNSLKFTALIVTLCGTAACGATPKGDVTSDTAGAQQDIVGGAANSGFTAVGMFINYGPNNSGYSALCTATLIGPRTVLTAAHCVMALGSNGEETAQLASPQNTVFYMGNSAANLDSSLVHNVSAINLPGGSSFPFTQFVANLRSGTLNDDDLAVVTLQDEPPVTPAVRATTALAVDQQVWIVGYGTTGQSNDNTSGTKRYVTTTVSGFIGSDLVEAGSEYHGTCSGDSGGPVIKSDGHIAAITQAGEVQGNTCVGGDVFTRLDVWADFINGVVQ